MTIILGDKVVYARQTALQRCLSFLTLFTYFIYDSSTMHLEMARGTRFSESKPTIAQQPGRCVKVRNDDAPMTPTPPPLPPPPHQNKKQKQRA